jgi:biotin carboxyl carrier protein
MKLHAEIGEAIHEVELTEVDGITVALIDGERHEVEVSNPEPNVFLIKEKGKVYEAFVSPNSDANARKLVSINGHDIKVRLTDPKKLRGAGRHSSSEEGTAEIKTAMPGKVVRVLLEAGASVEKGDGVLVVEAMKMQNELKSPKAGVVKEIRVAEGDTVAASDVLATIE